MYRSFSRVLAALGVACAVAVAIACNNATGLGGISTPTGPTTTETFTGTLTANGAVTFHFTATAAGPVSAGLTVLTAPVGTTVSLVLGTWDGTVCNMILSNDAAALNAYITGNVSAASQLCVRIADANGSITAPTPFTIQVTHP